MGCRNQDWLSSINQKFCVQWDAVRPTTCGPQFATGPSEHPEGPMRMPPRSGLIRELSVESRFLFRGRRCRRLLPLRGLPGHAACVKPTRGRHPEPTRHVYGLSSILCPSQSSRVLLSDDIAPNRQLLERKPTAHKAHGESSGPAFLPLLTKIARARLARRLCPSPEVTVITNSDGPARCKPAKLADTLDNSREWVSPLSCAVAATAGFGDAVTCAGATMDRSSTHPIANQPESANKDTRVISVPFVEG